MSKKPAIAVLQFEIDRKRWLDVNTSDFVNVAPHTDETALMRMRLIARTAINDVIRNGGTFVFVATKDKITMVQRADAEAFDEPAPSLPQDQ